MPDIENSPRTVVIDVGIYAEVHPDRVDIFKWATLVGSIPTAGLAVPLAGAVEALRAIVEDAAEADESSLYWPDSLIVSREKIEAARAIVRGQ